MRRQLNKAVMPWPLTLLVAVLAVEARDGRVSAGAPTSVSVSAGGLVLLQAGRLGGPLPGTKILPAVRTPRAEAPAVPLPTNRTAVGTVPRIPPSVDVGNETAVTAVQRAQDRQSQAQLALSSGSSRRSVNQTGGGGVPCGGASTAPCQPSLLSGGRSSGGAARANRSAGDPVFSGIVPLSFSLAPQWDLRGPDPPTPPTLVLNKQLGSQGMPGASLLLELHLRRTNLQKLRSVGDGRNLAAFLLTLSQELSHAAGVDAQRIGILAIHERYQRLDPIEASWSAGGESLPAVRSREEVVVRFEVTAAKIQTEPDPRQVLDILRTRLASPGSTLLSGPLGSTLQNATISLTLSDEILSIPRRRRDAASVSAMALPIGISAAFTGILIWIAAW
mmetsp:Transcript_86140/g.184572  ORF Transcript_86140/g.184572 Transcript_86140/m.184572 type:complete len:390 (-) Transcript_86140:197-1366(-)